MTNKIKHICAECKSDDVVLDAWAEWDIDQQEWVLRSVFDDAFCCSCEQACDMEEIELEDEPAADAAPSLDISMDIKPDADEEYEYRIEDDNPDRPVKYAHKFIDFDEIGDEPNPELKRAIAELLSKKP